jgi:hypothetical protein
MKKLLTAVMLLASVHLGLTTAFGKENAPAAADSSWQAAWDTRNYNTIKNWYRANTGINYAGLTDANLTPSGTIATTATGQVIQGKLVTGQIEVYHNNVTIRNCKIRTASGGYGVLVPIEAMGTVKHLNIENVSFIGATQAAGASYNPCIQTRYVGQGGNPATDGVHCSRVYISGYGAGLWCGVTGDQFNYSIVESIKIDPTSHNSGVDSRGDIGRRMYRSWIEGSTSSALAQYPNGPFIDMLCEQCLFDGGTYSVYGGGDGTDAVSPGNNNIRFINNRFTRNYGYGVLCYWDASRPGNLWSGNQFLDGQPAGPNTSGLDHTPALVGPGSVGSALYPNPYNGQGGLVLGTRSGEGTELILVSTPAGRTICTLGRDMAARNRLLWDGTNAHGRPMPDGMYLLQITAHGQTSTHRLMLVR